MSDPDAVTSLLGKEMPFATPRSTPMSSSHSVALSLTPGRLELESPAVTAKSPSAASQKSGHLPPLEPCEPIDITFRNVALDVKIQADKKTGPLSKIAQLIGVGGGGPEETRRILHGLSGEIRPGKMVALMGASGAGKSTLLNVLSRRVCSNEGQVRYNGTTPTALQVQSCSAFIQQLDLFLPNLTVREHLDTQIKLRLPEKMNNEERKAKVKEMIDRMSLTKCEDNVIGRGLSGGEKKRLSVASELLTSPSVLFADEPTTGLDSHMAISVVKVLRHVANAGRVVIATIHQPSSDIFEQFDELLLLSERRTLYFGDRLGCLEWLRHLGHACPQFTNPADFIVKVVAMPENDEDRAAKSVVLKQWADIWESRGAAFLKSWDKGAREDFIKASQRIGEHSIECSFSVEDDIPIVNKPSCDLHSRLASSHSYVCRDSSATSAALPVRRKKEGTGWRPRGIKVHSESAAGISWLQQVVFLTERSFRSNSRDPILFYARAFQTVVVGLIFGFLSFRLGWSMADARSKLGAIYTCLMNQGMSGAMNVASTFNREMPVIRRERESGFVRGSSYVVAKMLADAPVQILFPLLFTLITYFLMGLDDNFPKFIACCGIQLLVANAAMSMGYLGSALTRSAEMAIVVTIVLVNPMSLFGGQVAKLSSVPVWIRWIQWISFFRYGFTAFSTVVFYNRDVIIDDPPSLMAGDEFLEKYLAIKTSELALCLTMLAVLIIVLRLLVLIAMSIGTRYRKENE